MDNGMSRGLKVFLSGSVRKGEGDLRPDECFWSEADERILKAGVGKDGEILNPNTIKIPRYLHRERFTADMEMLLRSDVVVVDARTKKGLGVGAEMALAKQRGIPVWVVCPIGSPYRGEDVVDGVRQEWMHPFVSGLSDRLFESVDDLAGALERFEE